MSHGSHGQWTTGIEIRRPWLLCRLTFCLVLVILTSGGCGVGDEPEPSCALVDCPAHSTCFYEDGVPDCECDDGYSFVGDFCEPDTDACGISLSFGVGHAVCVETHSTEVIVSAMDGRGGPLPDGTSIELVLESGYFVDHDGNSVILTTTNGRASDWVYCGSAVCTFSGSVDAVARLTCTNGVEKSASGQVVCMCDPGSPTLILESEPDSINYLDQTTLISGTVWGADGNPPQEPALVELSTNLGAFVPGGQSSVEVYTDENGEFTIAFSGNGDIGTATIYGAAYVDCMVGYGAVQVEVVQ